ncbi:MAG: hypothetical protein M3495_06650 [Pseudomonadota bacterium]|nr:hypothetical protein [Pseudomonadota bacterium]
MLGCIGQAETVLVVCTPMLKGRYEKTAAPDAGRGATYEGAIVTQRIYDAVMRNTKFFPILPDGGSEDHIPTTLKPWWNGHRFPGGNEGIRRMVFAESAGVGSPGQSPAGGAETGASPWSIGDRHQRLAARCSVPPAPCRSSRGCKTRWPANSWGRRHRKPLPRWCNASRYAPPSRYNRSSMSCAVR